MLHSLHRGVHTNFNYVRETFGGVDWTGTSNVLLTNGLLDPWYGGGILASQADDVLAILIRDAAHHLDLNTPCNNDPEHVVQARYVNDMIACSMCYLYFYLPY